MKIDLLKKELEIGIFFEIKSTRDTDKKLWEKCFFDTKEDIDKAVSALASDSFCASITVDGRTASQFIGVESTLCDKRGIYIYALCTDESYRGKGYMKRLIRLSFEYARSLGYEFLWLFPANEKLEETYKGLGFSLPLSVGASPVISSSEDFFLSYKGGLELISFDGDYMKLYELSNKILPFDVFKYAIESIDDATSISYILNSGKKDGYIISDNNSNSRILAISDGYKDFVKYEKRSYAYLMPIKEFEPCGILAERILR
jgi:GNAT superfamily N-acetyltransferase